MVNICLAACITATVCHVPPDECKPTLPDWATQRWVYDAAGIVAGESVHGCAECDLWIACTVVGDVMLREYHPGHLRPGRWHGWRRPGERHLAAVEKALRGKCESAPICAYLGSLRDYTGHWRYGLASQRQVLAIGNRHGVLVCVPHDDN